MIAIKNAAYSPGAVDTRLLAINEKAAKAISGMNEGVGSEGGFALQPQFSTTLNERAYATGEILSRVSKQEIGPNSNEYSELQVDDTTRVEGSQFGGIATYWIGEGGDVTASKPALKRFALKLKKAVAATYVTEEALQDATQLGAFLTRVYPQAMSFSIENAIFRGQDAAKPQGVLYAAGAVSIAKESTQSAASILYKNVQKMYSRAWGPSRLKGGWFINQDVEEQLYSMTLPVGAGGVPVLLPPAGASAQPYGMLFGRPIVPLEHSSTVGTKGDIGFIDFSQVLMVTKGGMDFASSIHVQFLTMQQVFRFSTRLNAGLTWSAPLTPANGSNTQSPVVWLDTRA
jgi:HK97 family phage major capsid protein